MADKVSISGTPDIMYEGADLLGSLPPEVWRGIKDKIAPNPFTKLAQGNTGVPQSSLNQYQRLGLSDGTQSRPASPALGPTMFGSVQSTIPSASHDTTPQRSTLGTIGGVLGRIGTGAEHVLGKIGRGAGDLLIPDQMKYFPSTEQHRDWEANKEAARQQEVAELGKTGAETTELGARARREDREDVDTGAGQQDILKVYSNLLATGQYDKAELVRPHVIQYLQDMEKPKAGGEPKVITTEGGKLSTLGADNTLKPVMQPGGEAPTIPQSSPVPGGALDIPAAPIAGQQATAFEKPTNTTPHTKEELQAQMVAAQNTGDKPLAKKLQQQLKDIDPLGENRIAVTVQGQQNTERQRGITNARAQEKMGFEEDPSLLTPAQRDLLPIDDNGNPIPLKSPLAPTAMTKNSAQTAHAVGTLLDDTITALKDPKLQAELGPYKGRINELMAGTIGSGNPDFIALRTLGSFDSSGMLKVHFGSRGGQQMYDKFHNLLDTGKMDADTLLSSLNAMKKVTSTYKNEVRTGQTAKAEAESGEGLSVKAPNGKTYNFPTKDAADKFKKAAGI